MLLLQNLGIMIIVATALMLLVRRIRMPSIVTFIVAGLLVGPVLGLVSVGESSAVAESDAVFRAQSTLSTITHVGIALLLFLVGLELSFERVRDVGRVAVLAGIGQVVFTAFFGFLFCIPLGFSVMESLFIATALTFSSTVVVVKLLDQKKELLSLYGRIAVGIFLVQDLVVVIVLTLLAGLGVTAADDESTGAGAVLTGLLRAFGGMAVLLAVALVASRYLLRVPFEWAARSAETFIIWGLTWCFLFVIAAEAMGLSAEIGAFLAGISLAQLRCAHDLSRRLHPLMNFFIAVFFVSLGAGMELASAVVHWFPGILLSLFVLIGNPFIFMWIIARSGYSERTSFMTSVTVAQISEFSFIFAAMGLAMGLIDESILALVTIIGLITIVISSYMILYNHGLYAWCRARGLLRMFRAESKPESEHAEVMSGHTVVVGMNAMGRRIVRGFVDRGMDVLAVDTDPVKLRDLPCRTMLGNIDHAQVIEDAGVARAAMVVSALQIEEPNNLLTYRCRRMGVPIAVHAFDGSVIDDLRRFGANVLIDSKMQGNVRLVTALEEEGIIDV